MEEKKHHTERTTFCLSSFVMKTTSIRYCINFFFFCRLLTTGVVVQVGGKVFLFFSRAFVRHFFNKKPNSLPKLNFSVFFFL